MNTLTVSKLGKTFGSGEIQITALQDVSFMIAPGGIVLIMGPSGSGKTTLLSVIGGLLTPTTGEVTLGNIKFSDKTMRQLGEIRLRNIGFVFQSFNLLQNLTAVENVQIAGQLAGLKAQAAKLRAQQLLAKLHLSDRLHHLPAKLSGGQQQRVAVARALMNEPTLILADEPTGNLDSKSGHEVMMLFHNLAKQDGRTVVIVSHDERIKDIADRVLWIEDGQIHAAPPEPEITVADPVCGMKVDAKYASFTNTIEGKIYKFCSEDCQTKFVEHPYTYIQN